MWSIIIILILCVLVYVNLIKVMIYGKGVLRPNFRRVDEKFTARTGFGSKWNTPLGKGVYYILLAGSVLLVVLVIGRLML